MTPPTLSRPARLARRVSISLVLALTAATQVPSWSPDTAVPGLGGRVRCFLTWRGELIAGGNWFEPRGGVIRGVARYDGRAWQAVGTGVDALGHTDPVVHAMAEFGGELVAGGTFDSAGGQPASNVARWDGTAWRPLGQGLALSFGEAEVRALAVFNQELYAAGFFDTADGQPCGGFARWDGSAWHPVTNGFRDSISGALARARRLRVFNGELCVAGDFDRAGGVVARRIAAWNGTAFRALGVGMDYGVLSLEVHGTDLVAGGYFTTPVPQLAAWNGSTWRALGGNGPTLPVAALASAGGALWASYSPTQIGRWDGTTWTVLGGVIGVHSGTGVEGTVILALHPFGTELVIGGEFSRGGPPVPGPRAVVSANVIAFDGNATWRQLGAGDGLDREIKKILPWRGGWLAIGDFNEAGGVFTPGLAWWDGADWRSLGAFDVNNVEYAVVFHGDLIVSGGFQHIDGVPIAGTARFDGTRWQQFGPSFIAPLAVWNDELYNGGGGALRKWDGTSWTNVGPVNGVVSHLHAHTDGLLYLTAETAFTHLAYSWDGTQVRQIGAPNALVRCLGSFGNELVMGGQFTAIGSTPVNLLGRWNGTAWSAFAPGVTGFSVDAVAELEGSLHAAVNGDARGFLLRYTGTSWVALGMGVDGLPRSLFADRATASVWAGGLMLRAGGNLPAWHLAQWRNQPAWKNRLHGLAGSGAEPLLIGRGALAPGSPFALCVEAQPNHVGLLVLGRTRVDAPVLGGLLVPMPEFVIPMAGDAQGVSSLALPWPGGMPGGADLFLQTWLLDAGGPSGWSATNALQCTTP